MKRVVVFLLIAVFIAGCSSDKGNNAEKKAVIQLSSNRLVFSAIELGTDPSPQKLFVKNSGQVKLSCGLGEICDWLSINIASAGLNPGDSAEVNVSIECGGMRAGSYEDTIVIADSKAANSPQKVTVILSVGVSTKPAIDLSNDDLTFYAISGGQNPPDQQVTLTNRGLDSLRCQLISQAPWLVLEKDFVALGSENSQAITISADLAAVTAGEFRDTIRFVDANAINSPRKVGVLFIVSVESTYIAIQDTSSSWVYHGYYDDFYLYTLTANWVTRCYSNIGKEVSVFKYIATDTSNIVNLGEKDSDHFTLQPGQSRSCTFSFDVAAWYTPPPFDLPWKIWVGYRVDGNEIWTSMVFEPQSSPTKRVSGILAPAR